MLLQENDEMTKAPVILTMGFLAVACATGRGNRERAPAEFVGREWVVEDVGGRGLVDDSRVTLFFGSDGRLSGTGGCNRLLGNYVRRDAKLEISAPAMTMMACPPALMEQERRFADVLSGVRRYEIDSTGALVLTSSDGRAILAR
jgi:heat shock protein HslJ